MKLTHSLLLDLHMYFENIIIDRKTMKGMIHFYLFKKVCALKRIKLNDREYSDRDIQ